MSSTKSSLSKISKTSVSPIASATIVKDDVDNSTKPDFIYGGPFIKMEKLEPFMDTTTPMNLLLQGTFKKSFAYYSLRERMPVILTKVIDYLSREGSKIKSAHGASDDDIKGLIQWINKLKSELITNKKYELLSVDSDEARRWNEWILAADPPYYFTNTWVFTECYVYRRLREGCELSKKLKNFDPFDAQKEKAFTTSLELMCLVADKLVTMLPESDKEKRKADFITLLKICLWSNKCDLSLSMGEHVSLKSKENVNVNAPSPAVSVTDQKSKSNQSQVEDIEIDPFQFIVDLKDKLLVDDSAKIADLVISKAEALAKTIEGPPPPVPRSAQGSPRGSPRPSPAPSDPALLPPEEEPPKIPCPAKIATPQAVIFDIVCDNAGYELYTDLCLAHFLVAQKIVQKVRFHVKKIPWFVSDVTPRDFKYVIDSCAKANFKKHLPPVSNSEGGETESPPEPRVLNSEALRQVGEQWAKYVEDGTFVVLCDDFWTSPHVFKDMKKYDSNLYRKLQFPVAVLFKGDLNYRKLLGEKNWNPTTSFETALQGFMPAPVIALRTVKADLICGLPKGKSEQISAIDDKWMEKGDYGLIQLCPKAEPLKISERPCEDYGDTCRGKICPTHNDL